MQAKYAVAACLRPIVDAQQASQVQQAARVRAQLGLCVQRLLHQGHAVRHLRRTRPRSVHLTQRLACDSTKLVRPSMCSGAQWPSDVAEAAVCCKSAKPQHGAAAEQ